jgi:SCY1-like protein 2
VEAVELAVLAEPVPAVLMCALGVYEALAKLTTQSELLATRLLPRVLPLMTERALNLSQFRHFMRVARDWLTRIEESRVKELERQIFLAQKVRL